MFDKSPTRVLTIPCGSGVSQEIFKSLCFRRDVELYGLDSNENTPGKVLYGKLFFSGAPLLSDRTRLLEYVKYFVSLHEIKYVFPCSDLFINLLKEEEEFIGAEVISSPLETCIVSRRKSLTYKTLRDVVRVPKMFKLDEVNEFPVFIKPDIGAASRGCKKVDTMDELTSIYNRERDLMCEVLPGEEYTVDCFTKDGDLLYHCPRERSITRAGISIVTSRVEDNTILDEVKEMALRINETIEFTGAWFFQVKRASDNTLCLLEVAPRVAGAMSFSRMSGVNLPLLSLNLAMGLPITIPDAHHPERTVKVYRSCIDPPLKFDHLYTDLDDTLVLKGRVNHVAMACLYKYHSQGVPIHLITRRPTNLSEYLRRFHIPESLFTSVRQVHDMSPKSSYIVPNSVFIDDSFKERSEVSSSEKNIIALDIDGFEFL